MYIIRVFHNKNFSLYIAYKLHILLLQRELSPAQCVLEELEEETRSQPTNASVKASIEGVKAWLSHAKVT